MPLDLLEGLLGRTITLSVLMNLGVTFSIVLYKQQLFFLKTTTMSWYVMLVTYTRKHSTRRPDGTLCQLSNDILSYLAELLVGHQKLCLAATCRYLYDTKSLQYDGLRPTKSQLVQAHFYQHTKQPYLLQTKNNFYYTTCAAPTTCNIRLWLQDTATDLRVSGVTFACAFNTFFIYLDDSVETFVYLIVDNLVPCTLTTVGVDDDFQYYKLLFLLQNYEFAPSALAYAFTSACLYCHLPLITYLLSVHNVKASVQTLTVTLVSSAYPDVRTRVHVLTSILDSNPTEVLTLQNNCWPLLYAVHDENTIEEFKLLYSRVIVQSRAHNDINLKELDDLILHSLSEFAQAGVAHLLENIKTSLQPPL